MSDFTQGLRNLADWYDAHPNAEVPYEKRLNVFPSTPPAEFARVLGLATKHVYGAWYTLSRDFGGGVSLDANWPRKDVCVSRVVGTRIIPAEPAKVIPATPERVEEVMEWECGALLTAKP